MNSFPQCLSWRWIIKARVVIDKTKNEFTNRGLRAFALVGVLTLAGCRQDMHNQPKFSQQRGTSFYADGRSVRPQVAETVARGQLHEDSYFYTGMVNGQEGATMPFPVTMNVLARGQERYNVYCTPCHSRVGNGAGMIVQRGYAQAGNFHTTRLLTAPLGHFYNVIANGYGAMPDYSSQLAPEDRWAVVAYVKALQLSQSAQESDIAAGQHPEPLTDLSEQEGLPANFAAEWTLPPTSVTGTPDGQPYVLPRNSDGYAGPHASQYPAQPALSHSNTVPAIANSVSENTPRGQTSTGYPPAPVGMTPGK